MLLIILIIVLVAERYFISLDRFRHYELIPRYATIWLTWLNQRISVTPWIAIASILIPLSLATALLVYTHTGTAGMILEFLVTCVIFAWCIGPVSLEAGLSHKPLHQVNDDDVIEHPPSQNIKEIKSLMLLGHYGYLAIIFWFILLGPIAVVVYRITREMAYPCSSESAISSEEAMNSGEDETSDNTSLNQQAITRLWQKAFHILDWIPSRFTGLLFLLAGNFTRGFDTFRKHVGLVHENNEDILLQTGFDCLGANIKVSELHEGGMSDNSHESLSTEEGMGLIERSLWIFIVMISILYLSGFG